LQIVEGRLQIELKEPNRGVRGGRREGRSVDRHGATADRLTDFAVVQLDPGGPRRV